MKPNLSILLLILPSMAHAADTEIAGRYSGGGLEIDVQQAASGYVARVVTRSSGCVGEFTGKVSRPSGSGYFSVFAPTPEGGVCAIDVGPLAASKGIRVSQSSGCTYFHGAMCSFSGTVKRVGEARPVPSAGPPEYERPFSLFEGAYPTEFASNPPGARVIVDGEYIGKTPFSRNIQGLAASTGPTVIKALPAGRGCVQVESVSAGRVPRRMFFEMSLCPIAPSVDLNIN